MTEQERQKKENLLKWLEELVESNLGLSQVFGVIEQIKELKKELGVSDCIMNKSDEHPLYCDHLRSSHWGYLREPEARAVQEGRYGIRTTYFIVDAEERKLKRVVVYEKETMCTVRVFWVGDKDEAGDT